MDASGIWWPPSERTEFCEPSTAALRRLCTRLQSLLSKTSRDRSLRKEFWYSPASWEVEWNGPAFNPGANLIYVGAVDWCWTFYSAETARYIPGKDYMGGSLQEADSSRSCITAVEAASGKVRRRYRSSRPIVAAVTTTAGGVVFGGELIGDLVVFDGRSGDVLKRFNTVVQSVEALSATS